MSLVGSKVEVAARRGRLSVRRAFTLVELLVVIGIIAVLIGILLPTLRKARQAANAAACTSNVRQMLQATIMYLNENKGTFPPYDDTDASNKEIPGTHFVDVFLQKKYAPNKEIWHDPERDWKPDPPEWTYGYSHYNVNGFYYMFVWLPGARTNPQRYRFTRVNKVKSTSKVMLFHCTNRGGLAGPGVWGGYLLNEGKTPTSFSVGFVDGHAGRYPLQPFVQWTKVSNQYGYTCPPGKKPGDAEWWTPPWYPENYPWNYQMNLPAGF